MNKPVYVKFAHNSLGRFFSYKTISKKEKRALKKSPKRLNESFKASRTLKLSFKKRGFFSISHKDNICVVAFSKKGGFGVDLEVLKGRNFKSVVDFCFNESEKELFRKSEDKRLTFYKIFTAKEAIVKMRNLGFWDLSKVGYDGKKKSFCDEKSTPLFIKYKIIKKNMLFCVSFKEKRDIIF